MPWSAAAPAPTLAEPDPAAPQMIWEPPIFSAETKVDNSLIIWTS